MGIYTANTHIFIYFFVRMNVYAYDSACAIILFNWNGFSGVGAYSSGPPAPSLYRESSQPWILLIRNP